MESRHNCESAEGFQKGNSWVVLIPIECPVEPNLNFIQQETCIFVLFKNIVDVVES